MAFKFSPRSLKNLEGVHPKLVIIVHKALEMNIIDFTVTSGVRTQEEQNKLYAKGRTEPGKIVTWTKKSEHIKKADGFGHAVDLDPYPIDFDNIENYKMLASVMFRSAMENEIQIAWGGYWPKPDWGHFQLPQY